MIYIKLQNCCVSFFEVCFEGGTPKMYINQLKDVSNEVHFFLTKLQAGGLPSYQKYASLQLIFKIFYQICTVVIHKEFFGSFTNFCFPENLLAVAANRCKNLKTFISMKVTVYMQDYRLRSEKT